MKKQVSVMDVFVIKHIQKEREKLLNVRINIYKKGNQVLHENVYSLNAHRIKLSALVQQGVKSALTRIGTYRLEPKDYLRLLDREKTSLNVLEDKLDSLQKTRLQPQKQMLNVMEAKLREYDQKRILKRGYAIIRSQHGKIIKSIKVLYRGEHLRIQFVNGIAKVQVEDIKK